MYNKDQNKVKNTVTKRIVTLIIGEKKRIIGSRKYHLSWIPTETGKLSQQILLQFKFRIKAPSYIKGPTIKMHSQKTLVLPEK